MKSYSYSLRHHFIEASAGTGKTYTIMELVSYLIQNENLDLKKTLILTFTEKAAGELKERLRRKLNELQKNPSAKSIQNKVYELDEVMVSTIHGFCKSILEEYPIETGYSDLNVFKDGNTRGAEALYELEHKEWNGIWSQELPLRLQSSKYFENKNKLVIPAIHKLLSGRRYGNPDTKTERRKPTNPKISEEHKVELTQSLDAIRERVEQKVIPSLYKNIKDKVKKLWDCMNAFRLSIDTSNPNNSKQLFELFSNFDFNDFPLVLKREDFKSKGNLCTEEEMNVAIKHLQELTEKFIATFGEWIRFYSSHFFFQETVLQAVEIANSDTDEEWISFDAMISRLADSLERNPILLASLRNRFYVGIIDEFQDTDSLQYSIFRKIFLEGDDGNSQRALYLIGDPKQSIYGFRGADIGTYLQAKNDIQSKRKEEPAGFSLDTNYRSVENLILGYNEIFCSKHFLAEIQEAGFETSPIKYKPVCSPAEKDKNYALDPQFSDPPIQVVDLRGSTVENIDSIRGLWNDFIIYEIRRIKDSGFQYQKKIQDKDGTMTFQPVPLEYNDIAILVPSKNTGSNLLELLKRAGIPATYYQQEGIYQSREVDQILTILTCLWDSHNPASFRKILLTDAFRIHPEDLELFEEHSIDSYEKQLLNRWRISFEKRNFADLFRSIEQESKLLYHEGEFDLTWERKTTNYQQIFRKLLEISQSGKSSLEDLILELKRLKAISRTEEERQYFEKETESPAVQILTIHAAKGLEWPVVFLHPLAGEASNKHKLYDYPVTEDGKRVWKLSLWEENKDAYLRYVENEHKRKLYVALTRPKIRLYLPLFQAKNSNPYSRIVGSALEEIHSRLSNETRLQSYFHFRDGVQEREIRNQDFETNTFAASKSQIPSPDKRHFDPEKESSNSPSDLLSLVYPFRPISPRFQISSYSTLKDWEGARPQAISRFRAERDLVLDSKTQIDIEDETQTPFEDLMYESTLIAPGVLAGNYFHNLLENLEFGIFANSTEETLQNNSNLCKEIFHWIDYFGIDKTPTARKYKGNLPIREAILHETIRILRNAMGASLPISGGKKIQLLSLPAHSTVREMPFHWKAIRDLLDERKDFKMPSLELENCLPTQIVKGSIDLVFEVDGKYYLADYKSNLIGKEENLRMHVEQDEFTKYDLQRDIYSYVFFQYLKQCFGDENTALEKFGGMYYFFLRIMEEGTDTGIYTDIENWNQERFQKIEIRIRKILKQWRPYDT